MSFENEIKIFSLDYRRKVKDNNRNPFHVIMGIYNDIPNSEKDRFADLISREVFSRWNRLAPEIAVNIWSNINDCLGIFFERYNHTEYWVEKCFLRYSGTYGNMFSETEIRGDY